MGGVGWAFKWSLIYMVTSGTDTGAFDGAFGSLCAFGGGRAFSLSEWYPSPLSPRAVGGGQTNPPPTVRGLINERSTSPPPCKGMGAG
eukprot:471550-Prymnesium_polylepis.2